MAARGFVLLVLMLFSSPGEGFAQSQEEKRAPVTLLPLLKFEGAQRFDSTDRRGKLSMEQWKLSSAVKALSLEYSNHAPSFVSGSQFQLLPAGYNLAKLTTKQRDVTLTGFFTTGHDRRLVSERNARKLAGGFLELGPKDSRLGLFVLHAAPARDTTALIRTPGAVDSDSQIGVTLSRAVQKKLSLFSEWSQTHHKAGIGSNRKRSDTSTAAYLKMSATLSGTETNLTYRFRSDGVLTPALPIEGREERILNADVRRTFKQLEFQYATQMGWWQGGGPLIFPFRDLQQNSLRWIYSPKILPQLTLARVWRRLDEEHGGERDDNLRFSLNKAVKGVKLLVGYLHETRDDLALRRIMQRSGIAGDASLEVQKNRPLSIHYESTQMILSPDAKLLLSRNLRVNTRFSFYDGNLALAPSLDYRRQRDTRTQADSSSMLLVVSSLMKLPRYLPGKDLLLSLTSQRLRLPAASMRSALGLTLRWSFKSF